MNQEWEQFGKAIRGIVEDAVNSQDFHQLNKTITNTVTEAVNTVQKGLRGAGDVINEAAGAKGSGTFFSGPRPTLQRSSGKSQEISAGHKAELANRELFQKNTGLRICGVVLTACGAAIGGGIGIAVVVLFLVALSMGGFPLGIKIALSVLCPFLLGSIVMAWKGSGMLSSLKRYRNYIAGLQGRTYCIIIELAEQSGKSFQYVLKDVRKMIQKGWFRQGHLDSGNTCLIVSHDTYREYQLLEKQRTEQLEAQRNQQIQREELKPGADHRLREVMEEGQQYIQKLRDCSAAISGAEIPQKISRMEMLIQKIFDRVRQDPDSLEDIQKLMEYYLPTTVKLLEAYRQLDSQPVQGENIKSSKAEIEQTLDTLNEAFERLLDSLFEDVAWDVSADISVLHTMLAQEGLTGNDFNTI